MALMDLDIQLTVQQWGDMFKFAARVWVGILTVCMVMSLGFNVAVVGFASVSEIASGIYDSVTGTYSAMTKMRNRALAQERRVASLSAEAASLRRANSVVYRGEKRLLTEAITDTSGRIARRTGIAASRNASSVVAEAIPYIGIAAMLGVTAYDFKDSCDTMRDLHALNVAID